MNRGQAEDQLVRLGVPEETAVAVLDLLDSYGPYEVKLMTFDESGSFDKRVTVSAAYQGTFVLEVEKIIT